MPITITHKEYDARQDEWKRIADVLAGRDAVIEAGKEYVPQLGGHDPNQYKAYLTRGLWYGATARTLEGVVGLVFSQDPEVDVPEAITPLLDDITLSDMSFTELAKAVFNEVLAYSWGGLLADVNPSTDQVRPQDDRPYLVHYSAAHVRWWQREKIAGVWKTTTVILHEYTEAPATPAPGDPAGEYGTETIEQYRVLKLRPESMPVGDRIEIGYVYRQEIWQYIDTGNGTKDWRIVDVITPLRREQPLSEIPWTFTPTEGIVPRINKSHLLDVTDINLDYWRLSVDHRHGLHFTALPTACAVGFPEGTNALGSEVAWTSSEVAAKSWYLEFAGTGLGTILIAMDRDMDLMAIMGARLLETQKRAAETAEAMTIRQAGEHSTVMTVALSVSKALEKALWWMSWWRGVEDPQVSVNLTSALTNLQLTVQDLQFMLAAVIAGKLTVQAFVEAVVRSGRIVGRTADEELVLVEAEGEKRRQEAIAQAKLLPHGPPQKSGFPQKQEAA